MDEPESSRHKEVNSEIDDQFASDGKDDVVDVKEEGLASQTYDSLQMLTKVVDTTYRRNAYKKPFVILAGVSNHFLTTIFGCALLPDETIVTFTWVMLMEAMDGKRPISVVIDSDRATRQVVDATYRRNAYKKPFVILAGVSNHFFTTIFGCALLPDETIVTFTWVMLMEAMDGKRPISVVTDGDRAMRQLMLMKCKIDEFDNAWVGMVKQYKLENNNWVLEIYRKCDKWAEAYLRGHIFVGMRSTQRVEGMNAYFNMFLEQKVGLYKFVAQYDRALARMRVNDLETKSKTENSFLALTTPLRSLEKHAAELFTRKIFLLFRHEIRKEGKLFVMERVEHLSTVLQLN
ncbi:protein FAR1-RELATED SEQUENCE 5-like [Camellia sinensis]|uniref:protein FAR1-RELATED SEQUENCE 5-like n=1 Tax=Camellia sinensis TaxID=4442 RepID=UPI0010362C2C|nr:protein FAR1-RELATED SEQUENCE 5-like [Camellia sinensis]